MQLKLNGYIIHCPRSTGESGSRGNVIGIVTRLRPGRFGSRDFAFLRSFQTGCMAHLASYSMVTRVFCPGVKRPEHEADHSVSSSAQVNNEWNYTSTLSTGVTLPLFFVWNKIQDFLEV